MPVQVGPVRLERLPRDVVQETDRVSQVSSLS